MYFQLRATKWHDSFTIKHNLYDRLQIICIYKQKKLNSDLIKI